MQPLTQEQLDAIRESAGKHSQANVPSDPTQCLLFGLLEIVDWQCFEYGDVPDGVTEENVKAYLLDHKDEALALPEPPSFIGLMAGAYNFLQEDTNATNTNAPIL